MLPFNAIDVYMESPTVEEMTSCQLCTFGIKSVMHIGKRRPRPAKIASGTTGVMPLHKSSGRTSHNAIKDYD
jgi:hypothetical protein